MTEDEMIGRHHRLNGHEFEQVLGDGEGQGSLACCRPWGRQELDTTKQLNNNNNKLFFQRPQSINLTVVSKLFPLKKWGSASCFPP